MDLVLEFGALRLQLASSRGIARLACNWAIIQQQLLLCSVGGLWVVGLAWIWMFGTCQLEPGARMFELYQFVITSASTSGYMFAVVMVTAADQTLDIRLHCIFFLQMNYFITVNVRPFVSWNTAVMLCCFEIKPMTV